MAGHTQNLTKDEMWGGNASPFGVSYGKMMMWYFLVSDALTFGGLLTAYGVIRHGSSDPWPVGCEPGPDQCRRAGGCDRCSGRLRRQGMCPVLEGV